MVATNYLGYEVVDCDTFNPKPTTLRQTFGGCTADEWICLDTETSHNHSEANPIGWIYQWAFTYKDTIVCGRKPSEMIIALKKVLKVNRLGIFKKFGKKGTFRNKIIVYVHNLSYDYEYIKGFLRQAFPNGDEKTIAVSAHKVIVYDVDGLQFRCSYRLSNKSLDKWSKELNTEHKKLVGTIDYDVIRYQDSELDETDWKYMWSDVVVLDEAVKLQMKVHNDTIHTIPYTITGYVRRDARENFKNSPKEEQKEFQKTKLTLDTYNLCRKEFAGGLTHGNRFKQGTRIKGKIRHRDFASHYPSQQRFYYAPVGVPILEFDEKTDGEMELNELVNIAKEKCILCAITLKNPVVKDGITLPYLQTYKFLEGKFGKVKTIDDNGRIVKADGMGCIVVNEIDLKWIIKQYDFEYVIHKVYTMTRGTFPNYLMKTVDQYFVGKTVLKNKCKALLKQGYTEDSAEYIEAYRDLMIVKGKLNGIYGMSATDPVREELIDSIISGEWERLKKNDEETAGALAEYYQGKNNFMSYQLGVWTTALARNELLEFVVLIGYDKFLYADTDSIFYLSDEETERKIEERNAQFREECDRRGCFVDVDGKRVYYNQFELEDEVITEFKFLHSKCYAYMVSTPEGEEMMCTIAGVAKHGRNGTSRVKELGSLDELRHGKKFVDCGGTDCIYIQNPVDTITINGHELEVACSAIIRNTEKTLHGVIARDEMDIEWESDI